MSNEVLIALIGFASAVVGAVFGYLGNNRKQAVLNAQREQEQQDRFNRIEEWMKKVDKKLDSHNGYAERFADTSKDIALLAERQKAIQKDIEYLKSDRCKL